MQLWVCTGIKWQTIQTIFTALLLLESRIPGPGMSLQGYLIPSGTVSSSTDIYFSFTPVQLTQETSVTSGLSPMYSNQSVPKWCLWGILRPSHCCQVDAVFLPDVVSGSPTCPLPPLWTTVVVTDCFACASNWLTRSLTFHKPLLGFGYLPRTVPKI